MRRGTVWWNDAHGAGERNIDHDTLMQFHRPMKMASTGWIVRDDETGVMVVFAKDADGTDWPRGERYDYRGFEFIPKGMVTRVEYLEE